MMLFPLNVHEAKEAVILARLHFNRNPPSNYYDQMTILNIHEHTLNNLSDSDVVYISAPDPIMAGLFSKDAGR